MGRSRGQASSGVSSSSRGSWFLVASRANAHCFARCGIIRLSLPATLSRFETWPLSIPLQMLDLSMCADVTAVGQWTLDVLEMRLPRNHFAELTRRLLPGSRVEVLEADVDAADAERLVENLDQWGIDRLRIISPRLEAPVVWLGVPKPRLQPVTDQSELFTPSAVFVSGWRDFGRHALQFVRSIDISALPLAEFPDGATLSGDAFLESAILPTRLRDLPESFRSSKTTVQHRVADNIRCRDLPGYFFSSCWRLSHVGTAGCTALETIDFDALIHCRSLDEFDFPRTIRTVDGCARSAGRQSRRPTCRRRWRNRRCSTR
jgi:hypothetical protein